MKCATLPGTLVLAALLSAAPAFGARTARTRAPSADRTITQVVKLLQSMLDKSKADGDSERELYGKYKCYCDTNEAARKEEIKSLTEEIGLLESSIEELQASSAILSKDVAQLDADMSANKAARKKAGEIRAKDNAAFLAEEKDLSEAIASMDAAITVLSDIGADQSLGQAAGDHVKYMSDYKSAKLLKLKTTVRQALLAASSVMSKRQAVSVGSFLQDPFTGTYTAQAGEVVGILKDMRDTFKSNLESARSTEKVAVEAHGKYMGAMTTAYTEMEGSHQSKQAELSTNDSTLATKRDQLVSAETKKGEAETFLEQLLAMCAAKAKSYEERTLLRANEEAAIAEAISILNSDAAFETFGTVTATKSGPTAFFQQVSVREHRFGPSGQDAPRQEAQALLRRAAGFKRSRLLGKIVALLEANNPFTTVLEEIQKMIELLAAEEKADDEQLSWCNSERTTNSASLVKKKAQITTLEDEIAKLTNTIEDPKVGLKAMIQSDEDSLEANRQSQVTETKDRTEDNLAYQKDIENLVEAEELLEKAITVLNKYYSKILSKASGSFIALSHSKQPTPPGTWTGPYKGQSGAGGTDAIGMLKFILKNTEAEETAAHDAEKTAQYAFEDSMKKLKEEESQLQKSLAKFQKDLAETQEELLGKEKDLKATDAERAAIEAYLLQIKPGCDFITTNIVLRKDNRVEEKAALEQATTLLKGTPAYLEAEAAAHNETLGDCLAICTGNEAHVDCKACLAHVSVPAYCAGHAGVPGC